VNGVYMNTKNDDDRAYNYFSAQLGYHPKTSMGQGNYRVYALTTDGRFSNHAGTSDSEKLHGFGISLDQEFGETFGGFVRAVWVNDYLDLSLDVQYETDKRRDIDDPSAWIVGTRVNAVF
jgi:porin